MSAKRRLVGACVAALACVALAPVGAQAASVTFLANSEDAPGWNALVTKFRAANPGIDVEVNFVPISQIGQTLRAQFAANTGPDVGVVGAGGSLPLSVIPIAQAGFLTPIPTKGQAWAEKLPASYLDLLSRTIKVNGKQRKQLYATPIAAGSLGLLYNAGLLQQKGWKVPRTHGDLLRLCKAAKAAGMSLMSYAGTAGNRYLSLPVYAVASALLPANWASLRKANKTTFASTAAWTTALQRVLDMKNMGCFAPGAEGTTPEQTFADLATGKVAMIFSPTSAIINPMRLNPSLKVRALPILGKKPADATMVYNPAQGLAVNAKAKDKQAALTFVQWAANNPTGLTQASNTNAPVSLLTGKVPSFLADLRAPIRAKRVTASVSNRFPSPTVTAALNGVQGLFTGQKTIPQILADADKAWG